MSSSEDGAASPAAGVPYRACGLDALRLLAIDHQRAARAGCEHTALAPEERGALERRLVADALDVVVLSTCNRIELYWCSLGSESDAWTEALFRGATGLAAGSDVLLAAGGEAAARHLFRVTCGLESPLLGESEVMGQVRASLESSRAGELLAGVFHAALRCGGIARAETAIGEGARSIASAGAHRVVRSLAGVERPHVLVVGAGATGRSAARQLRADGIERITIVNRTLAHAEAAARALGAAAAPLADLPALLGEADGAVLAVHTLVPLISARLAREVMRSHPRRTLVICDLSMPHAVEGAVGAEPGIALHDLRGLESFVHESRARRERELPRVEDVIQRELAQLNAWARQQQLRPLMAEFRRRAERIRLTELRRIAREDLTDADVIDRLSRRLVERLITIPLATLREAQPEAFPACGLHCMRGIPGEPGHGTDQDRHAR